MQTAFATLPKLYARRFDGISTPVVGSGYGAAGVLETLFDELRHDERTRWYGLALWRDPCTDTAFVGALGEVGIRHLGSDTTANTFDVYLTLKLVPEEGDADVRVLGDVLTFTAFVVGVEDKLSVVDLLQQERARSRATLRIGCSQDDGRRLNDLETDGFGKPLFDFDDRIGRHIAARETAHGEVSSYILYFDIHDLFVWVLCGLFR